MCTLIQTATCSLLSEIDITNVFSGYIPDLQVPKSPRTKYITERLRSVERKCKMFVSTSKRGTNSSYIMISGIHIGLVDAGMRYLVSMTFVVMPCF